MSLTEYDLKSRLARFLGRKAMPRRLEGKDLAQADEIEALVSAVTRCAPRGADALAEWWPRFEASLGEMCGGMWPTEREIRDAGAKHRELARSGGGEPTTDMSPAALVARQMARGEPVGEHWLYGLSACEMIGRGLVSEPEMTRYRSSWFHSLVRMYGRERAEKIEADARARHESASEVWAQRAAEHGRSGA